MKYTYFQPNGPGELQTFPPDGGPKNTLLIPIGGSALHVQGEGGNDMGTLISMWFVVPSAEHVQFSSNLISISQGANHWNVSPDWHSTVVVDGKLSEEVFQFDSVLSDATFSGSFPSKGKVHSAYRVEIHTPKGLSLTESFTIVLPSTNESPAANIVFTPQVADYWHEGQIQ